MTMGRGGHRWKKLCEMVYAEYGPVCWLCSHSIPGGLLTGQVDHVLPYCSHPELQFKLENLRPVHGGKHRCPQCGHRCNLPASPGPACRIRAPQGADTSAGLPPGTSDHTPARP